MVLRGPLTRLLELVRRELGAVDARFELGGLPPTEPTTIWHGLDEQWRLVVLFDEPPEARVELVSKLETLVQSFAVTTEPVKPPFSSVPPPDLLERRLDEVVGALADLARGSAAIVVDRASPVIWASSRRREGEEVRDLIELGRYCDEAAEAGVELAADPSGDAQVLSRSLEERLGPVVARRLAGELVAATAEDWQARALLARAVAEVRSEHAREPRSHGTVDGGAWVARSFAGNYLLIVTYVGDVPELALERGLHRALPHVEALLLRLPPHDPGPAGARRALRLVPKH